MAEALGDEAFLRLGSLLEGEGEVLGSETHTDEVMDLNHSELGEDVGLALLEARVSGKGMGLPLILPREVKIMVQGRGEVKVEGVLPDKHTIGDLKRMVLQEMGYSAREIRSLREGNHLTLRVGCNSFPDRFLVGATGLLSDGEITTVELDSHMIRTLVTSRSSHYRTRDDGGGSKGLEAMFFSEIKKFEKSFSVDEEISQDKQQDSFLMLLNGYRRVCQELMIQAADSVAAGVARMTLSRGMSESSAKLLYTSETLAEELWRQERDTWDLLAVMLECRLEDSLLQGEDEEEKHAALMIHHQLYYLKPTSSDDDVVEALSRHDGRYRLNASICAWLEHIADEDAEVIMGGKGGAPMECTIRRILQERSSHRVGGLTSGTNEAAVKYVGPDATIVRSSSTSMSGGAEGKDSLQVCPLSGTDEDDELELMQGVWRLLRAGRWPDAVALCVSRGAFWRAASLSGGHMSWAVDEDGMRLVVKPGGNHRRALWREMCWNLSNGLHEGLSESGGGEGMACYESAIYAALAGDKEGLLSLPLLHSWEDYAWVFFTASRRRIEDAELMHHHERQAQTSEFFPAVDTLPSERRLLEKTTADNDLTPEEIFSQLSLISESISPAVHKQARRFAYRVRVAAILKETALRELLITAAKENAAGGQQDNLSGGDESNLLDPVISSQTRFAAHLILFLRRAYPVVCADFESAQACESLLAAYVAQLIDQGEVEVVSLYAAHLSSERRSEAWLGLMSTIPHRSPQRYTCLKLARECFPGGKKEAAELARQACRRAFYSPDSDDAVRASGLEWLCFEESMRGAAIAEANAFMRALIINPKCPAEDEITTTGWDDERIGPVRSLLFGDENNGGGGGSSHWFCMPSPDESSHVLSAVPQVLLTSSEVHDAMREYNCWVAFMRARDALGEWRKALAKAKILQPVPSKLMKRDTIGRTVTREKEVELLKAAALKIDAAVKESKELLIWTDVARVSILDVLTFQGRWMVRVESEELEKESGGGSQKRPDDEAELELLRCRCLPVLLLTLHTVMHDTGKWHAMQGLNDPARDYLQEARRVADLAVSDRYGLYRVMAPSTAANLLRAILDSSSELLCLE